MDHWNITSETRRPTPGHSPRGRQARRAAWLLLLASLGPATLTFGQPPQGGSRYYPLDHRAAPGVIGQWSAATTRDTTGYFQPVRVELPVAGDVTFYGRPQDAAAPAAAPAAAALQIGPVYRIRLAHIEGFPGVELYPTIELLDRLHPPAGKFAEYPIPIPFSLQELQLAAEGRLVTKIVYLEQPDRAIPLPADESASTRFAGRNENALALADELGRPMAIVRVGGRLPDADRPDPEFYGRGAPLVPVAPPPPRGPVANRGAARRIARPATAVAGQPPDAAEVREFARPNVPNTAAEGNLRELDR